MSYEGPYFEKYVVMDATPMGEALTRARIDLVHRHYDGRVVDVGIGGGRFVSDSGGLGFDVNPTAVAWLKTMGCYQDPYLQTQAAISCWDSLEHIPDPEALIAMVTGYVFVSIPVFDDPLRAHESKHYRPGEHLWYWSTQGLIRWFDDLGFDLLEQNDCETALGREGIRSFAFGRRHAS